MEPPCRPSEYAEGTERVGEDGELWVVRSQEEWVAGGVAGCAMQRRLRWLPKGREHRALRPGAGVWEWTYFATDAGKTEALSRWAGVGDGQLTDAVRRKLKSYGKRQELFHCLRGEEVQLGLARGLVATLSEPAYAGAQHGRARAQARKARDMHARRVRALEVKLGWRKAK